MRMCICARVRVCVNAQTVDFPKCSRRSMLQSLYTTYVLEFTPASEYGNNKSVHECFFWSRRICMRVSHGIFAVHPTVHGVVAPRKLIAECRMKCNYLRPFI